MEDLHGIETVDDDQGEMTQVDKSDGVTLMVWLSISGQFSQQVLDNDGLAEILTCLVFILFPSIVGTTVKSENNPANALSEGDFVTNHVCNSRMMGTVSRSTLPEKFR